jgi:hypothetical protein
MNPERKDAAPMHAESPAAESMGGRSMDPQLTQGSGAVELISLFPRTLLKGRLPDDLLQRLLEHGQALMRRPEASPDASAKLAGQLSQQRELRPDLPLTRELCESVLLPGTRAALYSIWFPLLFVAGGIGMLIGVWRRCKTV